MKTRGNTNKSPIKLSTQQKINNTVICLRMGKTYTAKTPPGDFKVTIPEISLLSQQAITSKGISVPYINLQLNPYPNTQLDLFCSDNFAFWCTTPEYVTSQLRGSQYATLITNWESCWLQSSSVHSHDKDQEDAWSQNFTVQIHSNFFKRMRWIRVKTSSPVTICLSRVCSMHVQLVYSLTALKTIILYV